MSQTLPDGRQKFKIQSNRCCFFIDELMISDTKSLYQDDLSLDLSNIPGSISLKDY